MEPGLQALERSTLVPRKERYGWAWIVSIGLHGLLFSGLVVGSIVSSCQGGPDLDQKPIAARLVRLGKPREEKLLPRLPNAPPEQAAAKEAAIVTPGEKVPEAPPAPVPPAPTEVSKPTPAVEPSPAPAKAQPAQAEAPKSESKQKLDDIMKRFAAGTRKGPAEELPGQLDGDAEGDSETAAEGERYLALVEKRIKSQYVIPSTIPDEERIRLVAVVTIRVERTGAISDFRITQSSGNSLFDAALESAVKRASPLPPPPAHLLTMLKGLPVRFRI